MIVIIFLCIMKSHLFAMFVWNFMTTSLSIAEILLFIKRWSKIAVTYVANQRMCHLRNAYLCPANIDVSVKHLCNFCINKNKMVISREDQMLIKVLHQEKGSRKLLAEFPNKEFELIPTVFTVLETCVFRLVLKDKKYHNIGNAVHWNFTHRA